MTRDAEIRFLRRFQNPRRHDEYGRELYSQTARAMFQLHKEHSIFIRRLKRCDVLLADVYRRGSRVLKEHDTYECKSIRDMG